MLMRNAFFTVVLVMGSAGFLPAETYSVKDLGLLTNRLGRTLSMPTGISNRGKVCAINLTNGAYRAQLYGGAWTNLGTLGGGESFASAVDDTDRVIGSSLTAGGLNHAFLWTPGGTNGIPSNPPMKDLGTLGGTNSEAYGINVDGGITGFADTSSRMHAFRYRAGTMTDIGKLLGTSLPNSIGYGINDAGHIAGTAYPDDYGSTHAFFYDGTTAVDIGNLGGQGSTALAINNADRIAGYLTTASGAAHAFQYLAGKMTDLGTLGGLYSYALAINNSNAIVGGSFTDPNNTIYHAFLFDGSAMVDLNTQLDRTGAGWTLLEARGINDSGQIIGTGQYDGANHVFLLNPLPRITGFELSGADVMISFTTINQALYAVAGRDNLASGSWGNELTGVLGNGGILTVTNAGAATLPKRFYRVDLSGP